MLTKWWLWAALAAVALLVVIRLVMRPRLPKLAPPGHLIRPVSSLPKVDPTAPAPPSWLASLAAVSKPRTSCPPGKVLLLAGTRSEKCQ